MTVSVKAGIAYFALVFAAGFILGTLRVLVLVPRLGELTSGLIELPVILGASWYICVWLIKRLDVPPYWQSRLIMGVAAFALLMFAEVCLSLLLFGRSISEHFISYLSLNSALGLAGQLLFAAFPLIQIYTKRENQRA